MVLTMAEQLETFHSTNDCDGIGKSLSGDLQDRGPPNFPSRCERESWNLYDKKLVHTEYISKSSMTSDNSNKRICVRTEVNPQPSEVPSLEELCRAPHVRAESNGDWVISMMNHYDFPSDIKSMLAAKLLDNPSMFPLMVGFDEKALLSFIRGVSNEGLFDTWYMEWTAR